MKDSLFPQNVRVSPETWAHMKKGHPWILKDAFTERFPHQSTFLRACDERGKPLALFLHDPHHPAIKGRIWSMGPSQVPLAMVDMMEEDLRHRLEVAIKKRQDLGIARERENFYLIFGEGDALPGLFLQVQGSHLLMQTYCGRWNGTLENILLAQLEGALEKFMPDRSFSLWAQERGPKTGFLFKKQLGASSLRTAPEGQTIIREFGLRYHLDFTRYDFGIYTDMASIRKSLQPSLHKWTTVLNLFSYTGAFSLFSLKKGGQVTSVDISQGNMQWLQKNLDLNPDLPQDRHHSLTMTVGEALKRLEREKKKFDGIICDPPSVISLGTKKLSAVQFYEVYLIPLLKLLGAKGQLAIFLNTHKISQQKFQKKIQDILLKHSMKGRVEMGREFSLGEDCPRIPHFPEGDYLKGIFLTLK